MLINWGGSASKPFSRGDRSGFGDGVYVCVLVCKLNRTENNSGFFLKNIYISRILLAESGLVNQLGCTCPKESPDIFSST